MTGGVLDLQNIRKSKPAGKMLNLLSGFPKFNSVFALTSAGLPVSKCLIISDSSDKTRTATENIIGSWNSEELLIRTDKKGGAVNAASVQNCKSEMIWPNIEKFIAGDFLVMLMAAGDVYHNTYSINIKVGPGQKSDYYLEIVGPGFCATDLNKRDIVQERGFLSDGEVLINSRVVNQDTYKDQVKVLLNSIIEKEVAKGKKFVNRKESETWVNKYLRSVNALILKNPTYKPIGKKYLKSLRTFMPMIRKACLLTGYGKETQIVSMSFVAENGTEKPYFWKIHPFWGYKG